MTVSELQAFRRDLDLSPEAFADITGISAHKIRRGRLRGDVFISAESAAEMTRCQRIYSMALELCSKRDAALDWLYAPSSALCDAAPIDLAESDLGLARIEGLMRNLRQAAHVAAPIVATPARPASPLPDPKKKHRIAEGLRAARSAVPGLTKAELVRRMQASGFSNFKPTTASCLEYGYADASVPEIVALAKILAVEPAALCSAS